MALANFGTGNAELFKSHRQGRAKVEINPKILAQVTSLLKQHGIVQGQDIYTATQTETDAFNDKRASAAKSAGKEAPERITVAAMAERNARRAANGILPYVVEAIDTTFTGKSYSLRFVNQGASPEQPRVLWAFVLINERVRKPKANGAETEQTATA